MSDYIHLIGAEDVRSGGHATERGGDAMRNAASTMEDALRGHTRALEEHQVFLRDWLVEYERVTRAGAVRYIHGAGPL